MKKATVVLLLFICSFPLQAQDTYFRWAKQFPGGENADAANQIAVDKDGNVYTAGIFAGTVDFDPGPATSNLVAYGAEDVFISKLDANGNFVWAKQLGNEKFNHTYTLSLDKDANIYIAGSFNGTFDFDPGPGVFSLTGLSNDDTYVVKLSRDGDFVWVRQFAGDNSSGILGTSIDAVGNIVITGAFNGSVDFDPGPGTYQLTAPGVSTPFFPRTNAFVCKLNPAGNFMWAVSMGGTDSDRGFRVSTDAAGDIYVTGDFRASADFDPGPGTSILTSNGDSDFFIVKLHGDGTLYWAKSVGGTSTDYAYTPKTDAAGNIYVTGFFRGTTDFDPGPGTFMMTATGGDAIFVLKLDASGNLGWAKSISGPSYNNWGYDLELDAAGNVYVSGFFLGPADFDPGPGVFILAATIIDAFLLRLDKDGNFNWAKSFGAGQQDQALSLFLDPYGSVYACGHFSGTTDFDFGAAIYNLAAADLSDVFILKIAQCLTQAVSSITTSACDAYTLNGQDYTTSGSYTQTLLSSAGCDSVITLNLTINHAQFTSVSVAICEGAAYYAGGANQTQPGTYVDRFTGSTGCDSTITTHLSVIPAPRPDLGTDRSLCSNGSANISPGNFATYRWQDNSTAASYNIHAPGKYWVTVTGTNNCPATDTLLIFGVNPVPQNFLPADKELCYGNTLNIAAPGYKNYLWSTNAITSNISVRNFGKYYLTVTDHNNCTGVDSIEIKRANCIPISIPNAFTPDGNGINDVFKPTILQEINRYSMIVYNRYGQKVFESAQYGKGWNGTCQGKEQPAGSYVYQVSFTNAFGYTYNENGSVLLIR